MQCLNPIKAGFTSSGELTFKKKNASKELVGFELECRKCLPCRLNIAREKSIRAIHEAKMHKDNIFLTLTYSPEHLKSDRLQYLDFQLFMKSLRELHTRNITDPDLKKEMSISYMVTGEYGEHGKRPHWHAIIFNYSPPDLKYLRTTERGDQIFTSAIIDKLWGKNDPEKKPNEIGSVTIESAGYTARYAAKKLVHGNDGDHDYHPVHKTSSRHAIGRTWIEKNWEHTFNMGYITLPNGQLTKIPRYYVDWLKKHQPDEWEAYVTHKRLDNQIKAQEKARAEELTYLSELMNQPWGWPRPISRNQVKITILNQKFKLLQEKLKL